MLVLRFSLRDKVRISGRHGEGVGTCHCCSQPATRHFNRGTQQLQHVSFYKHAPFDMSDYNVAYKVRHALRSTSIQ